MHARGRYFCCGNGQTSETCSILTKNPNNIHVRDAQREYCEIFFTLESRVEIACRAELRVHQCRNAQQHRRQKKVPCLSPRSSVKCPQRVAGPCVLPEPPACSPCPKRRGRAGIGECVRWENTQRCTKPCSQGNHFETSVAAQHFKASVKRSNESGTARIVFAYF